MKSSSRKRRSSLTPGEKLMFLAGILFCLILITTAMMAGLFARYLTGTDGKDSARVAAFDVGALMQPEEVTVVCEKMEDSNQFNTEGSYTVTVESSSEVAVTYDIVITLESALPGGVELDLYPAGSTGAPIIPGEVSQDGKTLTYAGAGSLPPGPGNQAEHALVFSVDWSEVDFTKNDSNDGKTNEESTSVDFTVDVTIVQID